MTTSLQAIIVDDEPPARRLLSALLRAEPDVVVTAECETALEALTAIAAARPDFILLDIQLPGSSGLELARQIDPVDGPVLVFITAHEKFAAEAFDVCPVDYILKPVQEARFRRAVQRVRRMIQLREERALPDAELAGRAGTTPTPRYLDRTFVRMDDRIRPVRMADVFLIESVGNYVKLHTSAGSHILRSSLSAVELRLDPRRFLRSHRSFIVNVDAIREIIALPHGEYRIVMERGIEIPLSRRYRERLDRFAVAAMG